MVALPTATVGTAVVVVLLRDVNRHPEYQLMLSRGKLRTLNLHSFPFSIVKLLVRDRVNPALIPRMAAKDPHETHPASSEDAPAINRLVGVL